MVSKTFDWLISCPIFPSESIKLRTNIIWRWVSAKKHVTVPRGYFLPKIKTRIICDLQMEQEKTINFGFCPEENIMHRIVNTSNFKKRLISELSEMGIPYEIMTIYSSELRVPVFSRTEDKINFCAKLVRKKIDEGLDKYR